MRRSSADESTRDPAAAEPAVGGADAPVDPDTPETRGSRAAVLPAAAPGTARNALDRRRILGAAVELIDQDGLRQLTMRRLGAHLGVEAMALYHWVPGRESLLDGVVETVVDELYGDPDVHLSSPDWQEYLQRLGHGVRRIALAHPKVFPLIATRPPAAPWVHPPLRSLRWMESFLTELQRCGFSDAHAVAAYRAFSSFLLGHLLLEVSTHGADIGPIEQEDPGRPDPTDLAEYPRLSALQAELSQDRSAEEFEEALEVLLDRLERLLDHPPHR
ncbi:TetR/AcrR family transcriptional regulator [Nakamurella leprariae]|uniref:TetR/AcrR family transcriptional regulator C-terminal domain-containing protein n=1 Tax=Nakamurella leprariae TaxID=2803911 RepID=A0A938YGP1_9ACTN|nr:TetR/AcrR family transcriptional regulator C-terminal domain-containing protein [Nakamurella leprariae]MBM9468037.1 TetR/AcrR family transcriptional regulator C-terminal domain-containing protein [Nakamurella leprariae]